MKLTAELQTPAGYNDTDEVTLTDSDRYADAPHWDAFEVQVNGEHVGYLIDRGELVPGGGRYRYASADIDGVPIDSHTGIGEAITTVLEVRLEMARR